MSSSQYAVIGAGLAGAATAWSLARRGHEVTLVERTQPASRDGSSHGSARIFRYAYADPFYVRLVVAAKAGFDELERLSDCRLITPSGALDFGPPRDPRGLARVLEAVGVEHELLSADDARARWPQIAVDSETLWHPGAGVIDAESTVRAMVVQAERHGAQIVTGWPVARVEATATGYRLETGDGRTLDAERIVVTAGGWLPALLDRLPLPSSFRALVPPLQVSQENAYHFPYRDGVEPPTAPRTGPPGRPSSTRAPPSRPTACRVAATPDSADRRSPSSSAGEGSPRPPTRTGSSTRRTARASSTTSGSTCRACTPSRTPRRPACSPAPRARTSSSTAPTASRWSPPAPGTAPSSPH